MIGDRSAARASRLDHGCALADALFERASIEPAPGDGESSRRRGEALRLLEESVLPTTVFDIATRTPRLANAAWRALFGARDVYAIPGVDDAARAGSTLHLAELALDLGGRLAYCAASVRARDGIVVAVCCEITDEVVARELAVDGDALVWGGPLANTAADYFNHQWPVDREDWRHAIHPGDVKACEDALARALRDHAACELEARLYSHGDPRWHRVRFVLVHSTTRWFGTAIDIHDARIAKLERDELLTLERAARADAERANRLKDRFLAVVSHELRTPLTAMVLWEGILRDQASDNALRARALDAIKQSMVAQSRVVGDLLDISRANANKLHVDLRPVDIEQLVRGSLEAISPSALAKQVGLERRGTPVTGTVLGDMVRLRQVLDNLLTNAVKFTDAGGQIAVTVSRRGRSITIEVTDTGRGIVASLLPRLFDPFTQTDDSPARMEGGLGLGLAISKRLVELHHGTLVALSDGPGCGTTLKVVLPATAARASATPQVARIPDLARVRVLVVDDDQRVRDVLGLLLNRAGAVVDTADSAEAGRRQLDEHTFEAVVCDIAMPGEDGYSFIRGLRASKNTIAAIALTAYASQVDVGRALAAGFDRHLAKPVDFECLLENLDELVVARRTAARAP